jgi:hypothetical protein
MGEKKGKKLMPAMLLNFEIRALKIIDVVLLNAISLG